LRGESHIDVISSQERCADVTFPLPCESSSYTYFYQRERPVMPTDKEKQIKDLLKVDTQDEVAPKRVDDLMRRVRAGIGQRDTLLFALVRIWTVIVRLLAPVFARLAVRKAEIDAARPKPAGRQSDS
jgi:hypothetical protein